MSGGEFHGRRVTVMGLGRFGGGIGVARWLAGQGAAVTVTDLADGDALSDSVGRLADLPITYRLGDHPPELLHATDLLVVSPAVPKDRSDFFRQALARGIAWTTEMNLFVTRCPARVVGVTGTAGKSTTCAMIESVLRRAEIGRVWFGGNIGRSLLADLAEMQPTDNVVLELSSFQLEDLAAIQWSPPMAVITNFSPHHLDRHGTAETYLAAKLNIVRFQRAGATIVLGQCPRHIVKAVGVIQTATGASLRHVNNERPWRLGVPGRHNRFNAAVAAEVCEALGVAEDRIEEGLSSFAGLPHRLQLVCTRDGVSYYNDSKSTTPGATMTALESFDRPVIAIVGGKDIDEPLEAMCTALISRASAVICFGDSAGRVEAMLSAALVGRPRPAVLHAADLPTAVTEATRRARDGDIVLLSPGFSSYDHFVNYEHRGDEFVRLVVSGG